MIAGILKEPETENRVSLLPEEAAVLQKLNIQVIAETGAGRMAYAFDEDYAEKGIQITSRNEVLRQSDILLSINLLAENDISLISPEVIILGVYQPLYNYEIIKTWADKNITTLSIDMIPRTTRAQSMDVLSSQANIAGYKAVIFAAALYPRYIPMFITAAGSIRPAKVLVLGAGVAGLQAIATARRLGAVVEVFDTRPAVKEEVMSLGGKFIEVTGAADASAAGGYAVEQSDEYKHMQQQRITEAAAKADIIITTAQIPGKLAPMLLPDNALQQMKPGSVIIDLAAATGGNTAQTKDNQTIEVHGITIAGNSNLASGMPADASKLYGKNILGFLQLLINKKGEININFEDDIIKGACITYNGEVINERVKALL